MIPLRLLGRAALVAGSPHPASVTDPTAVRTLGAELDTAPAGMSRWPRFDRFGRALARLGADALATASRQPRDLVTGVYTVSAYSCHDTNAAFHQGLVDKGPRLASPLLFPYTLPGAAASELAMHFGLGGEYLVLAGGPAAALAGALAAADALADGPAAGVLLVAADVLGTESLRVRAAGAAAGVVLAEGGGALWLAHAEAGGIGPVLGLEGAFAPAAGDLRELVRDALRRAGLTPRALARVLSCTVPQAGREAELAAVAELAPYTPLTQLCFKLGDAGAALGTLALLASLEEPGPTLVVASDRGGHAAVVVETAADGS